MVADVQAYFHSILNWELLSLKKFIAVKLLFAKWNNWYWLLIKLKFKIWKLFFFTFVIHYNTYIRDGDIIETRWKLKFLYQPRTTMGHTQLILE